MPVKFQISDDTESKLGRFQQALTMSDFKIKVQACDGIVVTSALHIASEWVRDMVRDRWWCDNDGHEPVIFLPDVEKRIVTLLDRILTSGSAEITLHERGNIHKISEKLQRSAQDLGFKLFNVDVRPVNQEKLEDTNNNKVVDIIQIDDEEDDDAVSSDSEKSIEYDELESEVPSHEKSMASKGIRSTSLIKVRFGQPLKTENVIDDININEQFSFEDAPSSFGDITSERVADINDELFDMSQGSCPSETATVPTVSVMDIGPTEEVKSGDYYCSQCNKKFNREVKLKHHIKSQHGPRDSM